MLSHSPLIRAEYYRQTVNEIRQIAWHYQSSEIRGELFQLAVLFDRMAAAFERRNADAAHAWPDPSWRLSTSADRFPREHR